MTPTIDDKTGPVFNARVLEVKKDRIKLYNEDTGEEIWVDKNKLRIIPKKVLAYITLPGYSSRHAGKNYEGICIER